MTPVVGLFLVSVYRLEGDIPLLPKFPEVPHPQEEAIVSYRPGSIFFVGDIMLARRVEKLMGEFGPRFPFLGTEALLSSSDITVGNFEGTIPEVHVPTPELTFQFSVKDSVAPTLHDVGFDILSLANNHGYDHGKAGYENTIDVCMTNSILCIGDPYSTSASSTKIVNVGDTTVGFVFIHTLFKTPDEIELKKLIAELGEKSDIQVAYIHWGTEYERMHTEEQERLAESLIDTGIDVVMGHHPHVVEDIGLYDGKPIFYSLGNFVFDQYFSTDVMEGLGVRMDIREDAVRYELVPFTTEAIHSQPQRMNGTESLELLTRILAPVTESPYVDVSSGIITVPRMNI